MMAYVPTLLVVIACFIPHSCVADGVFGCGGFVKSDVEINYSLVEVRHSRSIIIMNLARLDLVALFRLFPSASLLVAHLGLNPVRVS